MQKIAEITCYVGLGILALFTLLWMLTRGLGSVVAAVLLFINSPLPWWIRILAATAVVAGFAYLFKRRRIRPNQKFVD